MERSPDDLLVERSLDDELPDDEYVRTHGTEIKEPRYADPPEPKLFDPFDFDEDQEDPHKVDIPHY